MAAALRASEQGLKIIDQARRKKGWAATSAAWCSAAQTSQATLRRFRSGMPIHRESFISICQALGINWEEIVDDRSTMQIAPTPSIDFFAYDNGWVGREQLVAELRQKVQGSCRVLILVGITGIGKTALAERLAVELLDWFGGNWTKFLQVNFDNEEQSSDFASVACRWLEKWGEVVTPEDRKDIQWLLYRLLKHLQENRYLVLMDSLEKILQGNEEEGWNDFKDEWWFKFFHSFLSSESCQSRFILTSQDLPGHLVGAVSRYPNFWYCQPLSGLTPSERLALFKKTELDISTESPGRLYLERIGSAYEGHPLTLRVIAGEIRNQPFYGNVVAYWSKYGYEIEEVEKAIEEARTKGLTTSANDNWQLERYTRNLRRNVRLRLEKMLNRLDKEVHHAYLLLCKASIYRCPVPQEFWLSHLEYWGCDQEQQNLALDALRDRYLVEEVVDNNQYLLRQHNLIRSVALEHLKRLSERMSNLEELEVKDQPTLKAVDFTPPSELFLVDFSFVAPVAVKSIKPPLKRMAYTAVINWLTKYKPQSDAPNLEKVRGYLEAFHLLCKVEEWDKASKILLIRLNTPTHEELHNQLNTWGYYREQINLYSQLLGKLSPKLNAFFLNCLGNCYQDLAFYDKAIEYSQQSLAIALMIGSRSLEGRAIGNLGQVCNALGNYAQAIKYFQQSLAIAREMQHRQGEGESMLNLGAAYDSLGNYAKAIECHQQSLSIAREIGDRSGEGRALCNLGATQVELEQYSQALEYLQASLDIFKEIGARPTEAITFYNLAQLHQKIGKRDLAVEYCDRALIIATDLGIPLLHKCQELKEKFRL